MVVFNEWFPIEKESIIECAEQRKTAESKILFVQSICEVSRNEITGDSTDQGDKMNGKMSMEFGVIDNLEKNDYFIQPSQSVRSFDESKLRIAESESFLSLEKRDEHLSIEDIYGSTFSVNVTKKDDGVYKINQKTQFTISSGKPKISTMIGTSSGSNFNPKNCYSMSSERGTSTPKVTKISPSVEKIMKDAKEKRKKFQNLIPIPVINLKFS